MTDAAGDTSVEDLTTRARIRNAALAMFAKHGTRATTIRGVAKEAGVTPSLVQYHFGTKSGLHDACDDYLMESLRRGVQHGLYEEAIGDPRHLAATYQTAPLILRYLGRALTEGSPGAAALFDQMVELTQEHLVRNGTGAMAEQADTRAQATVLTAMKLGVVVLHQHISRAMDVDALTPAGLSRVNRAMLGIISPAVIGEDLAGVALSGIERYQAQNPHGRGEAP